MGGHLYRDTVCLDLALHSGLLTLVDIKSAQQWRQEAMCVGTSRMRGSLGDARVAVGRGRRAELQACFACVSLVSLKALAEVGPADQSMEMLTFKGCVTFCSKCMGRVVNTSRQWRLSQRILP